MKKTYQITDVFSEYPDVVSVEQLQEMLKTSRHTAYALVRTGEIPSIKIGGAFKILKKNVIAYLDVGKDLTA